MGRARKTVPKDINGHDGYDVIKALAAQGARDKDIARALSMHPNTFIRVKRDDPKALAALDSGRSHMHGKLVGKAFEKAMGGSEMMIMFLLNNVFDYKKGSQDEQQANVRITLEIPEALTPDRYREVIEAKVLPLKELPGVANG